MDCLEERFPHIKQREFYCISQLLNGGDREGEGLEVEVEVEAEGLRQRNQTWTWTQSDMCEEVWPQVGYKHLLPFSPQYHYRLMEGIITQSSASFNNQNTSSAF